MGHAGQLGKGATPRFKLSRRRRCPGELKARKLAMHLPSRADALHDLLPDVTAFVEVQGLHLRRLLWQIAVANVLSVVRNASQDPPPLQSLCSYQTGAGALNPFLQPGDAGLARPKLIPARLVFRP